VDNRDVRVAGLVGRGLAWEEPRDWALFDLRVCLHRHADFSLGFEHPPQVAEHYLDIGNVVDDVGKQESGVSGIQRRKVLIDAMSPLHTPS
jgi:hypothetical protein